MSVVNQMLRDLDRRQGDQQNVYTQHMHPASAAGGRKLLVWLLALSLLGLAAGSGYVLSTRWLATEQIVITPAAAPAPADPAKPIATTPPVEAEQPAPVVAVPAPVVAAPTPVVAEAAPARQSAPAPAPVTPKNSASLNETPPPLKTETPAAAPPPSRVHTGPTRIDIKPQVAQSAEGEFKRAVALINQGRSDDARTALAAALTLEPRHQSARQTLAVMLAESRALTEAETLLAEGLRLDPGQLNFAVLLARLKVERGDTAGALAVLKEQGKDTAGNAEYRAFTAALLQKVGRHSEAVEEYRAALTLAPQVGVWWIGLGLSYEGAQQPREALDAFLQARAIGTLTPELDAFVERKVQVLR